MGLNFKRIWARLINPLRGRRIVLMSPSKVVVNIGTDGAFVRKLLKNSTAFEVIVESITSNPEALHRFLMHTETRRRIGAQGAFLGSLISNKAVMHRLLRSEAVAARLVETTDKGEESAMAMLLRRPAVFESIAEFFASNPEALSRLLSRSKSLDALAAQANFVGALAGNRAVVQRLARSDAFAARVTEPGRKGEGPVLADFLRRPPVFESISSFFAANPEALNRLLTRKTTNLDALAAQANFIGSLAGNRSVIQRLARSEAFAARVTEPGRKGEEPAIAAFLRRPPVFERIADFFAANPEALSRLLGKTRNLSALAAQGGFVESLASHPRVVGRMLMSPALATGLSGTGGERAMRFLLNRADIAELLVTAMKRPPEGEVEISFGDDETDADAEATPESVNASDEAQSDETRDDSETEIAAGGTEDEAFTETRSTPA